MSPAGVAYDPAGTLFIADSSNCTIRRIDLATGQVTTLAGSPGEYGSTDGMGSSARFSSPIGLAYDGAGNLFVIDNQTIRKVVVATGQVITLAGGSDQIDSVDGIGRAARFNLAYSLTIDAGNLYVLEAGRHASIRKVVIKTGEVTTMKLLPGGSGVDGNKYFDPAGIVNDGAGHLLFADSNVGTIYKVAIATGEVSVVAGSEETSCDVGISGKPGFCKPHDLALDRAGNLYVADCGYYSISKLELATGKVTTLAGSGQAGASDGQGRSASFSGRFRLAVDKAGDLLVSDTGNNAIRRVTTTTGEVTTIAGAMEQKGSRDGTGPAARFGGPGQLASDEAGNLFFADMTNKTIRKVNIVTGEVTTFASQAGRVGSNDGIGEAARFDSPADITSDGAGNLFVTDSRNNNIRKVVVATAAVTTFAGSGQEEDVDGPAAKAGFKRPSIITSDRAGHLFVVDAGTGAIRQIAIATGEVTTLVKASLSGPLVSACGLASDGAGLLFVADCSAEVIRQLEVATGKTTVLAGTPGESGSADGIGAAARFAEPCDLVLDGSGNLFIADRGNRTVRKLALATRTVSTVVGTPGRFGVVPGPLPGRLTGPASLAIGPAGELFIADENAVLVARF